MCWTPDPETTNLRGSIMVALTSCLFCLESAALLKLNEQQFDLFHKIQTSQTGGQLYSDTFPMVSALFIPIHSRLFGQSRFKRPSGGVLSI